MGEVVEGDFRSKDWKSFTIEVSWNEKENKQEIDVKEFYDHSLKPADVFRAISLRLLEAVGGLSHMAEEQDPTEEGQIAALVALYQNGGMRIGGAFANEESRERFHKVMDKLVEELNAQTEAAKGTMH